MMLPLEQVAEAYQAMDERRNHFHLPWVRRCRRRRGKIWSSDLRVALSTSTLRSSRTAVGFVEGGRQCRMDLQPRRWSQ
jgi:hypothetical protein